MKKISLNVITGYIVLLIVAAVTSVIGVYIVKTISGEQLQQYPDYYAIKGNNRDVKIQSVIIAKNYRSDQPATSKSFKCITKRFHVEGKFSRAYLYIEAKVDYDRPLTVWDDVYFKINEQGGHLIPNGNSLPVPPSAISKYLYDLRSISYFPTMKDKEKRINKQTNYNSFELFRDRANLKINAFISSDRPGGVIKELSIYYECFEGSKCAIREIR